MSPRKSSTSSGNHSPRPRYLGVEVAGDPSFSTRWLEGVLTDRLRGASPGSEPARVRVVRREGDQAVVEIEHLLVPAARERWNGPVATPSGRAVGISTVRSWGTLRGAKAWIRAASSPPRLARAPASSKTPAPAVGADPGAPTRGIPPSAPGGERRRFRRDV